VHQKNFGVFCGIRGIDRLWQVQSVYLQIFQRLTTAVGTVNVTERVDVNISVCVRVADIGGKYIMKG
jgi:hypothetical protein